MTTDEFWQLIETAHRDSQGDPEKQAAILTKRLIETSLEAILDFQRIYDALQNRAYGHELWNAAYIIGEGCGDDGFMDFRGWLIAQGRQIYEAALQEPESLADVVSVEKRYDTKLGYLHYVGDDAYKQKAQTEELIPVLREAAALHGTHPLSDDETQLKALYPRLWAKFG